MEIRCSKVGLSPDCDDVIEGEDEERLLVAVAKHGRDVHGLGDEELGEDALRARLREPA